MTFAMEHAGGTAIIGQPPGVNSVGCTLAPPPCVSYPQLGQHNSCRNRELASFVPPFRCLDLGTVGQQRSRSHRAPAILAATPRYLNARAFSIMGGTSEIQTNILAKALVGL
jgi:hypothetical protein